MLLYSPMHPPSTNTHQIINQNTHQTIPTNHQHTPFASTILHRGISQQLAEKLSQQNRKPSLMIESHLQTVSSFHNSLPNAFSRPYLALDADMARLKSPSKIAKILTLREVKKIRGKQSQQAQSLPKKRGISLIKEMKLKKDERIGKIELGGRPTDGNITRLKGRLYVQHY